MDCHRIESNEGFDAELGGKIIQPAGNAYTLFKSKTRSVSFWVGDILAEFDQYLDEYVYSKIWSELSEPDKKIVYSISAGGYTKIKDIREDLYYNVVFNR